MSTQFENLFVHPLRGVDTAECGLDGRAVIINGLDECRGTAEQCDIIEIIVTSARKRATPFRRFITSHPGDSIRRTMNYATVSPVRPYDKFPVSRAVDHEILIYLTDEFKKIRGDHSLPNSWPSEEALTLLVKRCTGLNVVPFNEHIL
ncbi:hypothetical protein D9756_010794 [Leucocoprinus leucothites]|uniref:Uncharacterized protein n=1 Tax=Leucocoprinus leucothites TaxID=201217 RepID=A0A8H5CUH2_9AGAR|nr:hypothetical protein D9756_010794 [Leucoagaricus leucothites]